MTGEMYGLFGKRTGSFFGMHTLYFLLGLIVLGVVRYFLFKRKPQDTYLEEEIIEEEFDYQLWLGALQHLRNHCDEYKQGVFMNELYRLFLDALIAKDSTARLLETATKEQIVQANYLNEQERTLLSTLYTPVFQSGERDTTRKNEIIDSVESLVSGRNVLGLSNEDD